MSTCPERPRSRRGFTLVELLVVVAIIVTLLTIGVPVYTRSRYNARVARAISNIQTLEAEISTFRLDRGRIPVSLTELGRGGFRDPWGNPYEYLNFAEAAKGMGPGGVVAVARKDEFLVPLNSTYDLYSKGKDGKTKLPIDADMSWDDIIRANDGAYVGPASQY